MAATSITIRIDEELKKQAEALFDEMGMDMSTAVTAFIKTAVRQQKIPFKLSADPFYSETNQARLRDAIRGPESGEGVVQKNYGRAKGYGKSSSLRVRSCYYGYCQ